MVGYRALLIQYKDLLVQKQKTGVSHHEVSGNTGHTNKEGGHGKKDDSLELSLVVLDASNHAQILLHALDVLEGVVTDVVARAFVELDQQA